MGHEIIRQKSPEEEELEAKQKVLSELEEEMASLQLELSTLESELQVFNAMYLNRFGEKFLLLDELKSKISAALAALHPEDQEKIREAQEAAQRAQETAEEVKDYVRPDFEEEKFVPSAELKALFHKVAKAVHPDLAVDEEDRKRRQQFMIEANKAYKSGDADRLQQILDAAEMSKPLEEGEDIGVKLIRVIRLISSVRNRMDAMKKDIDAVRSSDAYLLRADYEEQGDSPFDAIEKNLDHEIKELEDTLRSLEEQSQS